MKQILALSVENEMDLILAHKRTMSVAEKSGLSLATQTSLATAVLEIARSVIEHSNNGSLLLSIRENQGKYFLSAIINFDNDLEFTDADSGYFYAQKLVPTFNLIKGPERNSIEMEIGLPRSSNMNPVKMNNLQDYFSKEGPLNIYEEIKLRNLTLSKIAKAKDEEILRSRIINEQKNEFISIASHEMRTPITVLKAYTQLLQHFQSECSPNVVGMLEKLDKQTTKLVTLVQQLLDVSKINNGHLEYSFERVALAEFIVEMVSIMKLILPDHEITTQLQDNVFVRIDRLRMEQVFSNLMGNAAKYSEKNTRIHISTVSEDAKFVKIMLSDEGIGMSPSSMESIFDKFYRNERVLKSYPGLGMGLYITSKIVSDHGGKIWAESEEGIGSTFNFTIPVVN
jgi:signal transduction histidine kinase